MPSILARALAPVATPRLRRVIALIAPLMLAACGGSGPFSSSKPAMSLARSSVSCQADPGVACTDTLSAQPADGLANASLLWTETPTPGSAKAIADVSRALQADGSWQVSVSFKRGLPEGTYKGSIELNAFNIDFFVDVVPVTLAYSFSAAGAQGTLSLLAPLAGAPDWQTFNGNAAHTGMVDVTLDASRFTRRWTLGTPALGQLSSVAAGGQRVLATSASMSGSAAQVLAFDESAGTLAWSSALGAGTGDPPALANGRAYVASAEAQGLSLRAFELASGTQAWLATRPYAKPFEVNPGRYALTPLDGALYGADGTGGAVASHDAGTGATTWSAAVRGDTDPNFLHWTPAANNELVFANVLGRFCAFQRSSGATLFSLPVPGPTSGSLQTVHELEQAPVIVDANSVLLLDQRATDFHPLDNHLSMVDLAGRRVRWSADGRFTAHPVAGAGVVYAGNAATQRVEARDAASGALLWQWQPEATTSVTFYGLLLTRNLLFVSAGNRTQALDLATHQPVWSYPLAGQLALSPNGLLYILAAGEDPAFNRLVAINLQ